MKRKSSELAGTPYKALCPQTFPKQRVSGQSGSEDGSEDGNKLHSDMNKTRQRRWKS